MELKLAILAGAFCLLLGFNRTFMELKSYSYRTLRPALRFQSYLYGIEIKIDLLKLNNWLCFNRTFMELKYNSSSTYLGSIEFQSYLYGIEML